jgi:hypothetical protein
VIPRLRAFCLSATGVRFSTFEFFECLLSSLSSCVVHSRPQAQNDVHCKPVEFGLLEREELVTQIDKGEVVLLPRSLKSNN